MVLPWGANSPAPGPVAGVPNRFPVVAPVVVEPLKPKPVGLTPNEGVACVFPNKPPPAVEVFPNSPPDVAPPPKPKPVVLVPKAEVDVEGPGFPKRPPPEVLFAKRPPPVAGCVDVLAPKDPVAGLNPPKGDEVVAPELKEPKPEVALLPKVCLGNIMKASPDAESKINFHSLEDQMVFTIMRPLLSEFLTIVFLNFTIKFFQFIHFYCKTYFKYNSVSI